MLHKYFSYSFALRFHVPSLNKPCIIQYLVVCMCVFKKDRGRERRECLPIFVHLCVFCKQPLKHKWMALPQSAAVDSAVILFSFKKIPPTKNPKLNWWLWSALMPVHFQNWCAALRCCCCLLYCSIAKHPGHLKLWKFSDLLHFCLDQHKTTCLTACVR